jgi:hypothetical protein
MPGFMSPAVTSLHELLCSMRPEKNEGVYIFARVPLGFEAASLRPVATIRELEGMTVVVEERHARAAGLEPLLRAVWITLQVHSDLRSVGLTAAVASGLAEAGISCNVLAGACHDHIFVPVESADSAMAALLEMQARSQATTPTADRQLLPLQAEQPFTPAQPRASVTLHEAQVRSDAGPSYENAQMQRARFVAVDLSASSFEDVSLRSTVFRNVALSGASFHDVDLSNSSVDDASLDGMKIDGVLVSDLFRAYYQVNPR